MLLLLAENSRDWTPEEIGAKMYVDQTAAARLLDGLADTGLLVRTDGSTPSYRYSPKEHGMDVAVRELEGTYRHMRPRIVDLIYGSPNDDLESFSDAFRLRKGKDQ